MYPIIKIKPNSSRRFRYNIVPTLYSYQNCKCFYCNKFMHFVSYQSEDQTRHNGYTIDHLFPHSHGFGLAGNAVLACRKCNEKKGNRLPTPVEIVRAWEIYANLNQEFIATIIFP